MLLSLEVLVVVFVCDLLLLSDSDGMVLSVFCGKGKATICNKMQQRFGVAKVRQLARPGAPQSNGDKSQFLLPHSKVSLSSPRIEAMVLLGLQSPRVVLLLCSALRHDVGGRKSEKYQNDFLTFRVILCGRAFELRVRCFTRTSRYRQGE